MKTRIFSIFLVFILCIALPACGSGGKAGGLTEITIYSQLANSSGEQIGWAAEILRERFNVKVNIINEMDGTFSTRMAEGNLGDIVIFGSDGDQYLDAVEAGMLFDWEDENLLYEHGPYILENMPLALEKNRELSGGKLYGFGHDVAGSANDHDAHIYYPYLRWDLYTQLGRPEISTLEDYIPILVQMSQLEPTSDIGTKTYAVSSFPDWDGDMVMMVKSTAALNGYEELGMGLYNVENQTFQGCLEEGGEYLRALKFYNTLFQLGLYDPDSMTQTFDDAAKKYKNGVSFWNIFTFVAETFNSTEHLEAGKYMACIPAGDQKNVASGLNVYGKNRVWTIGAKTNYPELCMEIINWLSTPEGVLVYRYGPQGVTWDYDEEGNTYMTELGLETRKDKKTAITYKDYTGTYEDGEFQHNNTTFSMDSVNPESAKKESYNWESWDSTILLKIPTEAEQSWRDYTGCVKPDEYLDKNGHLAVSIGSKFAIGKRNAELDTTWEQVKMCIRAGSWSAIYAKTDEEYDMTVAKMIADAKAYGYEKCIEWNQEQAERRKAEENKVKGLK